MHLRVDHYANDLDAHAQPFNQPIFPAELDLCSLYSNFVIVYSLYSRLCFIQSESFTCTLFSLLSRLLN